MLWVLQFILCYIFKRIVFCQPGTPERYRLTLHSTLNLHLIRNLFPFWDLLRPNLFNVAVKQWSTIHEFQNTNE